MPTATIKVTLPALFPRQQVIVNHAARFKVVVCGRRFGKTQLAAWEALRRGLSGQLVWWVAPTADVARRGWGKIIPLVLNIPGAEIHRAVREIALPGGGLIGFKTADSASGLLGEGLDYLIVDEAAVVRESAWTQELRPALSDRQGGAMFISTPRGRNWFWRAYLLGLDSERADWQSWRFPTSANPIIPNSEIVSARELLPERAFKQEYLAEFLEDSGAVFRGVEACIADSPTEPTPGHRYLFGVDWGREEDFTSIAVLDNTTHHLVYLDRFREIGWSLQRGRLAALAAIWKPDVIWAEANSIGGPNIEALQAEGLPVSGFTTTAQSKTPLIESLALAFERREITIPNDPVLVGELLAYTMDKLPSGRFAYSAPPGEHDDTVIALALAWYGSIHSGIGISFT